MNAAAVTVIPLSGGQTAAAVACLLLPPAAAVFFLCRARATRSAPGGQPDWSLPDLEARGGPSSLFHSWHPAVKIASLLVASLAIVSLRTLMGAAAAAGLALSGLLLSRLPWQRPLRRLAAMAAFLALFPLVLPFTSPVRPGDTVLLLPLLDSWPFRVQGLWLALTVVFKAVSVALLMEPMLATAPLARTLRGFAGLGLPPALIQMVLLTHRYLFVFRDELARMERAAKARGFTPATNLATLRTLGCCFGMLFIRAFERTERVHQAMLCRGFAGVSPAGAAAPVTARDWLKAGCCLGLGLVLIGLDRLGSVAFHL